MSRFMFYVKSSEILEAGLKPLLIFTTEAAMGGAASACDLA